MNTKKKILIEILLIFTIFFCQFRVSATSTGDLWNKYWNRRYEIVINNSTLLLETEPENPEYNVIMGRALLDTFQFEKALPYLERANRLAEDKGRFRAMALFYLARYHYYRANYKQSEKFLKECVELDYDKTSLLLRFSPKDFIDIYGYDTTFEGYSVEESEHFIYFFKNNKKDKEIQQVIKETEASFRRINYYFKGELPMKLRYYVYDSMSNIKIHGRGDYTSNFAIAENCIIHSIPSTAAHEITHIISYYANDNYFDRGLFISEGVASYFGFDIDSERRLRVARHYIKEKGIEDISVKKIWLNFLDYPDEVSYWVAAAFVDFLIKEDEEKFRKLIKRQKYRNAKVIYGDQLDILIEEFERELLEEG